nr:hypothetical protein CFP56_70385 [Quercus suber]
MASVTARARRRLNLEPAIATKTSAQDTLTTHVNEQEHAYTLGTITFTPRFFYKDTDATHTPGEPESCNNAALPGSERSVIWRNIIFLPSQVVFSQLDRDQPLALPKSTLPPSVSTKGPAQNISCASITSSCGPAVMFSTNTSPATATAHCRSARNCGIPAVPACAAVNLPSDMRARGRGMNRVRNTGTRAEGRRDRRSNFCDVHEMMEAWIGKDIVRGVSDGVLSAIAGRELVFPSW